MPMSSNLLAKQCLHSKRLVWTIYWWLIQQFPQRVLSLLITNSAHDAILQSALRNWLRTKLKMKNSIKHLPTLAIFESAAKCFVLVVIARVEQYLSTKSLTSLLVSIGSVFCNYSTSVQDSTILISDVYIADRVPAVPGISVILPVCRINGVFAPCGKMGISPKKTALLPGPVLNSSILLPQCRQKKPRIFSIQPKIGIFSFLKKLIIFLARSPPILLGAVTIIVLACGMARITVSNPSPGPDGASTKR